MAQKKEQMRNDHRRQVAYWVTIDFGEGQRYSFRRAQLLQLSEKEPLTIGSNISYPAGQLHIELIDSYVCFRSLITNSVYVYPLRQPGDSWDKIYQPEVCEQYSAQEPRWALDKPHPRKPKKQHPRNWKHVHGKMPRMR